MLRIFLTPAVRLSFPQIDGLVQTIPKYSLLNEQKTGVIDESP